MAVPNGEVDVLVANADTEALYADMVDMHDDTEKRYDVAPEADEADRTLSDATVIEQGVVQYAADVAAARAEILALFGGSATGVVSWVDAFLVQVADDLYGTLPAGRPAPDTDPVIATIPAMETLYGVQLDFDLAGYVSAGNPPYTFAKTGGPGDVIINSDGTGYVYNPDARAAGTTTFTVTDADDDSVAGSFSTEVTEPTPEIDLDTSDGSNPNYIASGNQSTPYGTWELEIGSDTMQTMYFYPGTFRAGTGADGLRNEFTSGEAVKLMRVVSGAPTELKPAAGALASGGVLRIISSDVSGDGSVTRRTVTYNGAVLHSYDDSDPTTRALTTWAMASNGGSPARIAAIRFFPNS